ncbi:Aste57867_558 [Aphanomyces stellatus]|uniref:Serine/threonine-protein phosphatase n=1 Tax=Aphanomyces stellatus TaxID=120398 RepID=A0A485K646_9STRA|nr:hypothetical protein As57867_000557 [Aphanomyces stellatus]VFT77783.1 Aste57867_558 [Aphanomyces stellatus]
MAARRGEDGAGPPDKDVDLATAIRAAMTKTGIVDLDAIAPVTSDARSRADVFKERGNTAMNASAYSKAVEMYSMAISLDATAVYYANRAAAHLRLKNFDLAFDDASSAILVDPSYCKGYFRRGMANLGLENVQDALDDFHALLELDPQAKDAASKVHLCNGLLQQAAFAAGAFGDIAFEVEKTPALSEIIDTSSIAIDPSYNGPHVDVATPISLVLVQDVIQAFQRGQQLHPKYVIDILMAVTSMLAALPTLLRLSIDEAAPLTICGDTHGQFHDLCTIFELHGLPSASRPYVFNGDFVDRGPSGVEVTLTLFLLKLASPDHVHLVRGNHEAKQMNKLYGFDAEVQAKYGKDALLLLHLFQEAFRWLPLAACLNDKVFVVHGGLPRQSRVTLADIDKIQRNCDPPARGLMTDLLWSDPQPLQGCVPSKRGFGTQFGPDVTRAFLDLNELDLVVRSHELRMDGYDVCHDGRCVTPEIVHRYHGRSVGVAAVASAVGLNRVDLSNNELTRVPAALATAAVLLDLSSNPFVNSTNALTGVNIALVARRRVVLDDTPLCGGVVPCEPICTSSCLAYMVGNYQCDVTCSVAACRVYDGGECKAFTTLGPLSELDMLLCLMDARTTSQKWIGGTSQSTPDKVRSSCTVS